MHFGARISLVWLLWLVGFCGFCGFWWLLGSRSLLASVACVASVAFVAFGGFLDLVAFNDLLFTAGAGWFHSLSYGFLTGPPVLPTPAPFFYKHRLFGFILSFLIFINIHRDCLCSMCERIIEQAQRYQPPFNKGPSMKYSMWKLCSVWHLYSVRTVCSVWHLHSVWNFCSVWHLHSVWNFYSVWSFCYMGRFRFNNTPPSSERGPRFLIVGRKRVSAYDLWQCPCYRFKKEIACVLLSWYALRGEALRFPPAHPHPLLFLIGSPCYLFSFFFS